MQPPSCPRRTGAIPPEILWPLVAAAGATAVLVILAAFKGPFWLGPNLDPDYAYLFNGLLIATGRAPLHVDHPGTPVQELIALVLRVASGSAPDLPRAVIAAPEEYLGMVRGVLLTLLLAAMAGAGALVARATGKVSAGLWMIASVLLTPMLLREALCVKPEPLLLMASLAVGALTLLAAAREGPTRWPVALGIGVLTGVAITAKVTALPLLALAVLAPRGWRARVASVGATVISAALLLIPAYAQLWRLWTITSKIATQGGRYGNGTALEQSGLLALASRLAETPILPLALVVVFLGWLARRRDGRMKRSSPPLAGACAPLAIALVLQVALGATQPFEARYLLPGVTLSGAALLAGITALRWRVSRWFGLLIVGAAAVAVSDVATGFVHDMDAHAADQAFVATYPEAQIVDFYRASTPNFARFFGNGWSGIIFADQCAAVDPDTVFYNLWSGEGFAGYRALLPQSAALTSHHVIFRGATVQVLPELATNGVFAHPLAPPHGNLDGFYEQHLPPEVVLPFGDYRASGLSRPMALGAEGVVRQVTGEARLRYAPGKTARFLTGIAWSASGATLRVSADSQTQPAGITVGPGEEKSFRVPLDDSGEVRLRIDDGGTLSFRTLRIE